jgi:hypothetical protein
VNFDGESIARGGDPLMMCKLARRSSEARSNESIDHCPYMVSLHEKIEVGEGKCGFLSRDCINATLEHHDRKPCGICNLRDLPSFSPRSKRALRFARRR